MTGEGIHLVTGPAYHAAVGGFRFRSVQRGDAADHAEVRRSPHPRVDRAGAGPPHTSRADDDGPDAAAQRERSAARSSSLDIVLHGAAPIAPAVKRQMIDWLGPILVEYWGTSEAGVFTRVDSADWLAHPGTVGRPVPGFEVFAVDDTGATLPPGGVGRLFCHTPNKPEPFAYWNAPEKTASSYLRPGSSPSATWATSTTRGGSSSPTGPRT